jgi:hypothetical protein
MAAAVSVCMWLMWFLSRSGTRSQETLWRCSSRSRTAMVRAPSADSGVPGVQLRGKLSCSFICERHTRHKMGYCVEPSGVAPYCGSVWRVIAAWSVLLPAVFSRQRPSVYGHKSLKVTV